MRSSETLNAAFTQLSMAATAKPNMINYDPRTRLVGAVVLVVIAIIFLPMLFGTSDKASDDDRKTGNSVVMEITSEGKKVFVSRIAPIEDVPVADATALGLTNPDKQKSKSKTAAVAEKKKPQKIKTAPKKEVKPAESASKNSGQSSQSALIRPMYVAPSKTSETGKKKTTAPAATASAKKTTPPVTSSKKTAAPATSSWIVQVGSYSKKANADNAAGKLRTKGYTVHTTPIKTSKGTVTRVWLGPFKDRKRADKIQASVKRSTGMSAIIKTVKN